MKTELLRDMMWGSWITLTILLVVQYAFGIGIGISYIMFTLLTISLDASLFDSRDERSEAEE